MDLKKEFQQGSKADLAGIKDNLNALGMVAVIGIGGARDIAPGVADACVEHTGQPADQILHPPKTAPRQNGPFAFVAHDLVPLLA